MRWLRDMGGLASKVGSFLWSSLKAVTVAVACFLLAFSLSLLITVPWSRHYWAGDGQAVLGGVAVSFFLGIASAIGGSIYLFRRQVFCGKRGKLAKALLLAASINALLLTLAWAMVTGHLQSPRGSLEVLPMALSAPGWALAIWIWGWNSGESIFSDTLIIATNTFVYSIGEVLLIKVSQALHRRLSGWR